MPSIPLPVQNAIAGVVAGRADYDSKVATRDQAERDLASAQHAKEVADAAVSGGASQLNATIDAAANLLEKFRPGAQPPADSQPADPPVAASPDTDALTPGIL